MGPARQHQVAPKDHVSRSAQVLKVADPCFTDTSPSSVTTPSVCLPPLPFQTRGNSTFIGEPFCRYTLAVNGEAAVGVACEPGGWLSDGELVAELSANHQLMLIWIRWQKRLLDVSTKPRGRRLLKPWSFWRQNFPQ